MANTEQTLVVHVLERWVIFLIVLKPKLRKYLHSLVFQYNNTYAVGTVAQTIKA